MGTATFHSEYRARYGLDVSNYIEINCDARITFSENYNAANNQSTVAITKIELKNNTGVNWGSVAFFGGVKVNNTTLIDIDNESTVRSLSLPANSGWVTVPNLPTSSTKVISHNADGSGSFQMALSSGLLQESKYYFCGLYRSATLVMTPVGIELPASKTVALTSHTRQWTISYNANGGTGTTSSQTKTYGTALSLRSNGFTAPSNTTRSGYKVTLNANGGSVSPSSATATDTVAYSFSKWNTKTDGTGTAYSAGGSYTANAAATMYAQWSEAVTRGSVTLPAPTREGYIFNGWYTAATGGTKKTSPYTPTANTTLYAQWTPAASTITTFDSAVTTNGTFSLSVNRSSTSYYHKATFTSGGYTLATSSAFGTSLSNYSIPRTWFNNFPTATSISVTVSVQTYTSSAATTTVGSPATCTITVSADANMKPTVTSGWATAAPTNTGAVQNITGYVKGYSKATVSFDTSRITQAAGTTASGNTYKIVCQNTTVSASPYSTPVLTSTAPTIVCTVTDSRGRSASETLTLNVIDYQLPKITGASAVRCSSDGTPADEGTYFKVKATPTYTDLGVSPSGSKMYVSYMISGGSYNARTEIASNTYVIFGTISANSSYTVRIQAVDDIGNTTTRTITVPTAKWAMKFRPGGNGVAFGKAAETDNVFEVTPDWKIKSARPATDAFLAAHGISGYSTGYTAKRTDTGASLFTGVGSAGVYHGIYSLSLGRWIAYADASDVFVGGLAVKTTNIPSSASRTFTVGETKRGVLVTSGPSANDKSLTIFASTTTGTLSFSTVFAGSNITVSGSSGVISVDNAGVNYISAFVLFINGS